MATAEAEVAKLGATLLQTVAQAETLCENLDKGQDSGLAKLFSGIQEAYKTSHFPVLLAPLSPVALTVASKWLFGPDAAFLVELCLKRFGLIEVRYGQPAFTFHAGGQEHLRAETGTELLKQIAAFAVGEEVHKKEVPVLGLPALANNLTDVMLYIPRDLAILREQSKILLRLLSRCNLAAFTAGSAYRLSESDTAFLAEVLPAFEAVLPIVITEEQETPAEPWWRAGALPGNPVVLTEVMLPLQPPRPVTAEDGTVTQPPSPPAIPEVLKNPVNPCRQSLQIITQARKLSSAMEAVGPRCETESKQLTARQAPIAQRSREMDDKAKSKDTKGDLDAIKSLLEDDLQKIQMDVEDEAARSLMRRGKFVSSVRLLVEEISEDDFEDVVGTKTIRRTLTEDFFERVLGVVSRDLREQLKKDCQEVARVVKDLNDELDEILTRIRGSQAHLELPLPDEKLIWYHLKGEICITARCEVERPKRGVITVLTAGRKMMMPFFMTLGMIGFQSVKKQMASNHWQMVLVLVGACTYAYFEARSEQQEKFEKELEKIKDTLTNEIGKIVNDVQKEKVSRFNTYFNMLKKQTLKRVDEQVKIFVEVRGQSMDREKANLSNKLKTLDTRIKELQEFTKQMDKLQASARDLETNGRKVLVEASKAAPAAPARAAVATSSSRSPSGTATAARMPAGAQAAAGAAATAQANGAEAAPRVSRIPDIPRPERPVREPRPERPAREPKEKKDEEPKISAADRFAALRASLKK